jgi:hypothetical protein
LAAIHSFFARWDPKNGTQGAEPCPGMMLDLLFWIIDGKKKE